MASEPAVEVRLAPEGVLARLRAALDQKPKRILGIKVAPEFVGVVQGNEFEIWERRRHAVHLIGRVRGQRGGSRIELRSSLNPRTKLLIVVFFALFAILAYGFVNLPTDRPEYPLNASLIAIAGAAGSAVIFWWQTHDQRMGLRRFLADLYREEIAEAQG